MSDTSKEILEKWQVGLDSLTPEERLKMACSMFDFARDLVSDSLLNETPNISDVELSRGILTRFYGNEISAEVIKNVVARTPVTRTPNPQFRNSIQAKT